MEDLQLGGAAWCNTAYRAGQLPCILDRLAIHCSDDVAGFDTCLGGRPILLSIRYQRTLGLLQIEAVCNALRYRLNLNPDPAAADASLILELSDHGLHGRGGN